MISPEGHGWHVAKAIRGLPGGGRQMLLPGSCEDVIGHFLKSRDLRVAKVVKPLIDKDEFVYVIPDTGPRTRSSRREPRRAEPRSGRAGRFVH
jgi:hypothetical protein